MTPDPHDPHDPNEPTPRFGDGPPPFAPPRFVPAIGAGAPKAEAIRAAEGGATGASGQPPGTAPPPRRPHPRRGPTPRAWLAALIAAGVALSFYVWGAAPTVLSGDSAELAAAAFCGGVPHPTGYPTFVLLGQIAGRVLPGDPAHRITLMCALSGAVAVGLFAMLLGELSLAWGAVLAGALFYAGTFTLWWAAIRVEVYAPAIALAMFALWRVLVARRTLRARDGLVAAFAIGLALTGHLSFAPALALAGLVLAGRAGAAGRLTPLLVAGALAMLVLGLSPYLYLVFADAHYTLTNYLRYTIEAAGGSFGLTPARFDSVPERLGYLVFGAESHPHDFIHHLPTALYNLGRAWARFAAFEVGPLGMVMALTGEGALARRDRGAARLFAAIALVTPVLGALVADEALLSVFMMASTLSVAALAAAGLDALLARSGTRPPLAVALAITAILVPHELRVRADAQPLGAPWMRVLTEGPPPIRTFVLQLRHEREARARASATLAAIPESSFVAAKWEAVMVMKYLQSAEGMRPDLTFDPWYEPSHAVRLSRWRQAHPLGAAPVVVVGAIPGLVDRLVRPEAIVVDSATTLYAERHVVKRVIPKELQPRPR